MFVYITNDTNFISKVSNDNTSSLIFLYINSIIYQQNDIKWSYHLLNGSDMTK